MRFMHFFISLLIIALLFLTGCRGAQEVLRIGEAGEANPGPCPRAFSLYDASRIVEFRGDGQEAFTNVGFTGELGKIRSLCRYFGEVPIIADLEINFDLGRGPMAQEDVATYEYFVAVTRKNVAVIEKQVFPLQVRFPEGVERVSTTEVIDEIVIPRATEGTSGENFEIIVGFVVTPEQRQFNADGKRFRVSVGQN